MSKVTRVTTTLKTIQKLLAAYQRTKDESLPEMIDALLATVVDDLNEPDGYVSPLPIFVPTISPRDYLPQGVYVYAAPIVTDTAGFAYSDVTTTITLPKEKDEE